MGVDYPTMQVQNTKQNISHQYPLISIHWSNSILPMPRSILVSNYVQQHNQIHYSLLRFARSFLCPPRIREIWRPLLKAWLKSIRVWNSDTKGNHAKKAMGVNNKRPISISYPLAKALTEPHIEECLRIGLHACAIWQRKINAVFRSYKWKHCIKEFSFYKLPYLLLAIRVQE